jgi:hypothetical protein
MFYDVLMEKRALRRVNDPDILLAGLYSDDDDLKRSIDSDNRLYGGLLGATAGIPSGILLNDILHARPAKTRIAAILGATIGGTALGSVGAAHAFRPTDEYIRKLRAEQARRQRRNARRRRG